MLALSPQGSSCLSGCLPPAHLTLTRTLGRLYQGLGLVQHRPLGLDLLLLGLRT